MEEIVGLVDAFDIFDFPYIIIFDFPFYFFIFLHLIFNKLKIYFAVIHHISFQCYSLLLWLEFYIVLMFFTKNHVNCII